MGYLKYVFNLTNVILLFLNLSFYAVYVYIRIKMNLGKNEKNNTYYKISFWGYIICFLAGVRKGKSSTMNASTNVLEVKLMNLAADNMEKVINYFPKINFKKINEIILALNLNDEIFYSKQNEITELIMNELDLMNRMYNDFINCKTLKEHLEDYIEAFYVLNIRGIYVYSKTWRYSYVTRMTSKYLSDKTMQIKDVAIQKEFYLRKYSVILEDELNISRGNILSNSKNEKDNGRKEIKTLIGHIFEETCYYISAKQRNDDEISNEKYLYTNYIYIVDRKIYNDFNLLICYFEFRKYLIFLRYKFYFVIYHLFHWKIDFEDWILEDNCKYRKKKYFFESCIRYLRSLASVDVLVRDYDSFKDVGKENTPSYQRYEEYKLTFDLRDTIGNYNTHEFKFIRKILNALTRVYDKGDNTSYKNSTLMLNQAIFLFEHAIKQKEEQRREFYNDEF